MRRSGLIWSAALLLLGCVAMVDRADAQSPPTPRALFARYDFWDNRDIAWYEKNIPWFECPDREIELTYYYRWELVTKHLIYGSPTSGYSYTEFIDRPFWSGAYGAIVCPAGHQLYEVRWLRDARYSRDYVRYWFRTPGAEPRRYSSWLADSALAVDAVHPKKGFLTDLLADFDKNYAAWEKRHFSPEVGLFWQTGHDDGMEYNINSRQTLDLVRGAPAYRPTLNAYMYADAKAIAQVAREAGKEEMARAYEAKAESLKKKLQELLWDPQREFFFPVAQRDEERDGAKVKALSKTYETGKYAGSPYGRELIGYVPWQFNMVDPGYEAAWKFLMPRDRFGAEFGPTTVERNDPQFLVTNRCCWWSGQSWPYATTQTLVAMQNLLRNYQQDVVTSADYISLLQTYAKTHRKEGRPYLAEGANPDTGSWEGYDSYNHSEHYFHSGYTDLVITGLVGILPAREEVLSLHPLAPPEWDYFCLRNVRYRGRDVDIYWDRLGTRYGQGAGLTVVVDGKKLASQADLKPLKVDLPPTTKAEIDSSGRMNFAVSNDGRRWPRARASHVDSQTLLENAFDGAYWYHQSPPNRVTMAESPNAEDWIEIDFGASRKVDEVALYFLEDAERIGPPKFVRIELGDGETRRGVYVERQTPARPQGRMANRYAFAPTLARTVRVTFAHDGAKRTGLTEIEVWGDADPHFKPAPEPKGNLALRVEGVEYPRMTASHTSRFDKLEEVHDGIRQFRPNPRNRWTAYESKAEQDWIEVDFGEPKTFRRVELSFYDDRGGVKAPQRYSILVWIDGAWKAVDSLQISPSPPRGGTINEAVFSPTTASKLRIEFVHTPGSRVGLTELEVWND